MRWVMMLALAGCADGMGPRRGLEGDWLFTLSCDAEVDGIPACPGASDALVRLYDDERNGSIFTAGEHRTMFPGHTDGDDSYTGVGGNVLAGWNEGLLTLELNAYSDDPLASTADLDAWADHRLLISGLPGERCWAATWSWVDRDGVVVATGEAAGRHRWRVCEE